MNQKTQLRRSLLKTRQSLSLQEWQEKSNQICINLQNSTILNQSQTILAYFSFRQEPDLSLLFKQENYKTWGFPRCVEQSLIWHNWKPTYPLKQGKFGILEPDSNNPQIYPETVDLILVPAVACDRQGYRLGYGGGFYDRLLSLPQWSSIPTIGIVFESAYLPQLPIENWDLPLQYVCTENQLIMCSIK
ncbi:MAG: 5-formyltetrahydrofolate cyclo-ligase [Microcoleaceae cyanobacterium]